MPPPQPGQSACAARNPYDGPHGFNRFEPHSSNAPHWALTAIRHRRARSHLELAVAPQQVGNLFWLALEVHQA